MKLGGLAIACMLVNMAACVHVDEATREARQYRKLDWEHRFLDYQHRCYRAGGQMVIQASGPLPRSGVPRRSDHFSCTSRIAKIDRP